MRRTAEKRKQPAERSPSEKLLFGGPLVYSARWNDHRYAYFEMSSWAMALRLPRLVSFTVRLARRAVSRYGTAPGVRFIRADAVGFLRQSTQPQYDVVYSVHGLAYIDPHRLLPALAPRVRDGGRLVFSVLHTNAHGLGPSDAVAARDEILRLAGGGELAVRMWALSPTLWEDLLVDAGFLVEDIAVLDAPEKDDLYRYSLVVAKRPEEAMPPGRVSSRPRSSKPPVAQTAFGVAVIVVDAVGHVLLGAHHSGVWECPGGKVDPGESVEAAAVRELREETSLDADERHVEVIALLLDEVCGTNRMTAVAVVTAFDGTPAATEPHLVSSWQWRALGDLPDPLFVPSAQALRTWRPDLPVDHPPVHAYRVVQRRG